jgi:hypothetical protein
MSASTKDISAHARFIRNAAPQVYEDFCKEFEKYTEASIVAVIETTGEELVRAQGRAQQCLKILRVLQEVKNGN